MAVIFNGVVKLYYYLNDEVSDPRTQDWPLMRTPWPGISILIFYLFLVLKWLPKYMENRPAYNIRKILLVYNLVQILLCVYVIYQLIGHGQYYNRSYTIPIHFKERVDQSLRLGWLNHYSLVCQAVDDGPEALEYAWKVCYIYFIIKIADLLDTVFFVLRKKQNQVTFLHVYHHFGMGCVSWAMVKWVPGGHCSLLVPVNSFVHVVMYSYYMWTTWDTPKNGLWWKKYVTQIQILQFAILLVHFSMLVLVTPCPYPTVPAYILIPQNLFMVILFSEFYYRSYIKKNTNVKNK